MALSAEQRAYCLSVFGLHEDPDATDQHITDACKQRLANQNGEAHTGFVNKIVWAEEVLKGRRGYRCMHSLDVIQTVDHAKICELSSCMDDDMLRGGDSDGESMKSFGGEDYIDDEEEGSGNEGSNSDDYNEANDEEDDGDIEATVTFGSRYDYGNLAETGGRHAVRREDGTELSIEEHREICACTPLTSEQEETLQCQAGINKVGAEMDNECV